MQLLLTALATGALYGAIGIGYVIVHRLNGMVNFAMGDIAVAGAFGAVVASAVLPALPAIIVGAIVGGLVSVIMYHLTIHPLRNQSLMVQTIVTLGVGIAIRSLLQLIFGTGPKQFAPITDGSAVTILGGSIPQQSVWLIAIAVVGYLGLALFFDRTIAGKALSAFSVNSYAAGIVGISLTGMATIAFLLSGAIAGGVLAAQVPTSFITAGAGVALGLKGFIAAILGGFDKLGLTLVGGFLVAFVEVAFARYVDAAQASTVVFALLIVLLIVRPQGLTRKVAADRV
ncbi:branched-chain amino acid ABC transporter permease [Microbacterium sp. 179-B 1A2 NHS]|uniref:branched-chain amino acid ABC transporter permease n=1 Tax=Microbacterium sp. 179-B 1A2 NHS TaxID=3142383 RepID=UPI0039A0EC06